MSTIDVSAIRNTFSKLTEAVSNAQSGIEKLASEHSRMLDYLKAEFTRDGVTLLWELIHEIDPDWPNPWRDPDDPEGRCTCGPFAGFRKTRLSYPR